MFIAGNFKGEFTEKCFWVKQKFNNFYEESKFEAEGLIRNNFNSLYNSLIYRPSVIMGAFSSGAMFRTSNLYLSIDLFRKRIFDIVPLSLSTKHNIVPVDLAAYAIFLLSRFEKGNLVFNICAPKDVVLAEFLEKAALNLGYENPKFISFKNYPSARLTAAQKLLLSPMIPYFNFHAKFNAELTNKKLKSYGFNWPDLDDQYYQKIFKYASEAHGFIDGIS
jgi:nucleoside-diphosphate-sugar epimerase